MFKNQSKPLSINEIFEAYETHNDEFLILDIFGKNKRDNKDKLRTNVAGTVQYGDVLIKKADNSVVPLVLKFIQITTMSKIKEPKDRDYETLKLSFRKNDLENDESKFGEAMDLICKTFEQKVNQLVADNKIAVKPKAKSGSLKVLSTTPIFPVQYEVENRETGSIEELENPIIWIELKSQYYKPDEVDKLEQYDGLYYKKDGKPIIKKEFAVKICDLSERRDEEVVKYDPNTKKEVKKTTSFIPMAKDNSGNMLNNCNIQEFITPRSVLSGYVEMQLTISGRSMNLKTTFKANSNLYVYPNLQYGKSVNLGLDADEADEMIPSTAYTSKKPDTNVEEDEVDEEDDYDAEFSEKLDSF